MSTLSIPVSTVPAVRQYLYAQISAAVAERAYVAPGVTVELAELSEPEDYSDILVVGKTITRTPEIAQIVGGGGAHWLRERYTVSIHITCSDQSSPTFAAVDARAYELLAIVEGVVRADPSLNKLVIVAHPGPSHIESDFDHAHGGALALIESSINVHAEQ